MEFNRRDAALERETVLITGGAGFIGSHLTDRLIAGGHEVVVLDDLSGGSLLNLGPAQARGGVRLVRGSVLDADLVERCMEQADVCVHLAAALGVKRIVDSPLETLISNVRGTDTVMAAAVRGERRLVFASSSEVYGKHHGEALREDADCTIGAPSRSRWSYAIAKQFGESLANAYTQDAGADIATVRFFNVVGPRQNNAYGMVLPRFIGQALRDEPLTIYGDGSQTRCFTSVHDAVSAVELIMSTRAWSGATFNVGTSTAVRIDDLAARIIARVGSRSEIVYVPYTQAYGPGYEELGRRLPDTSALRAQTGWTAIRTVDETIDEVIDAEAVAMSLRKANGRRRCNGITPVPIGA